MHESLKKIMVTSIDVSVSCQMQGGLYDNSRLIVNSDHEFPLKITMRGGRRQKNEEGWRYVHTKYYHYSTTGMGPYVEMRASGEEDYRWYLWDSGWTEDPNKLPCYVLKDMLPCTWWDLNHVFRVASVSYQGVGSLMLWSPFELRSITEEPNDGAEDSGASPDPR